MFGNGDDTHSNTPELNNLILYICRKRKGKKTNSAIKFLSNTDTNDTITSTIHASQIARFSREFRL